MNLTFVRDLIHGWRSFRAEFRDASEAKQDAGVRVERAATGAVVKSLVSAGLVASAAFLLVGYPQRAVGMLADLSELERLKVEGHDLLALANLVSEVSEREGKRLGQASEILPEGHLPAGRTLLRVTEEIPANEKQAATDLGRIAPFEYMGPDWAREWAKSWSALLNGELSLWYAEDDLVDTLHQRHATAHDYVPVVRQIQRKALVLLASANAAKAYTTEVTTLAVAQQRENQDFVDSLKLRLEWASALYSLSLAFIPLALCFGLWLWLRSLKPPPERRKKAIATPNAPGGGG